jgi:hypothetical protein
VLSLLFPGIFLCAVIVCFGAESVDDQYLRIYSLVQEGDALNSSQPAQALSKYREARAALLKLQWANPDWNSAVVNFRLRYLDSKLGDASSSSAPDAPASPGGLFPKMPWATNLFVVDCRRHQGNDAEANVAAWSLQGLINQRSAEVYVVHNPQHLRQLESCRKPFETLPSLAGDDSGLRTLFQKYRERVKKMFVYDKDQDWTRCLALMAAAQQEGIAVSDRVRSRLTSEFDWKGEVVDFRNRWADSTAAYEWALTNLMPGCTRKVVFVTRSETAILDYVVATRGFVFNLDFKKDQAQIKKIFQTNGYGVGTSLMGYAGDEANSTANPYGIGYVVSDRYSNGSFWSSFPNKTYQQSPGRAIKAEPGKVYASIMWSDGDNIAFDQGPLYKFWNESDRGKIPVATALGPALQELNPPLLDWYYAQMTDKDELIAGPTGFQFVYIRDFNESLFPEWCRLNRLWCAGAGFHSARIWLAPNPSAKYTTYMRTCGLEGMLGEGFVLKAGHPPKIETYGAWDENKLFEEFTKVKPDAKAPVFVNFTPIVQGFDKRGGGYSAIKRQVEKLEAVCPGVYVFMLPKDQFATIQAYYGRP